MHHISYLVVHCSDSPNDRDSVNAEEIHKWHLERGFDGIGYHFVILRNGMVEAGRPVYWKGAHAEKINNKSIGICLIGKDRFTEVQFKELKKLLLLLKNNYPTAEVRGHRDFDKNKTCPNFDVVSWWSSANE